MGNRERKILWAAIIIWAFLATVFRFMLEDSRHQLKQRRYLMCWNGTTWDRCRQNRCGDYLDAEGKIAVYTTEFIYVIEGGADE